MNNRVTRNIAIEDAHILFRNFSGKQTQFNPEGRMNFCVEIDEDLANELDKEGWNVKRREPRDEGDSEFCYIQVAVNFDTIAPNVWLVTSRNKTRLTPATIGMLDYADIERVDLVIRPYNWEVQGRSGVKAYLKNMYVTIYEDEIDERYADIPDSSVQGYEG